MAAKRRKCALCGRNRTEKTVGYFARAKGATACYDIKDCERNQNK